MSVTEEVRARLAAMHPYREELQNYAQLPEKGRAQREILEELSGIARKEDARWETVGRVLLGLEPGSPML